MIPTYQSAVETPTADRAALLAKFIQKEERNIFPVSFAQSRLWILDRFQPENPAYNIPAINALQGWIDISILERALNEIVRRHESLRTVFRVINGETKQVVLPEFHLNLEIIDLRHIPYINKEAEMKRIYFEESRRPFDLEKGPLIRATYLKMDNMNHMLIVVMHHIVSDGWSMTIFYRELAVLYMAFLQGRRSPLPELSIQYADFAQWQSEWFQGEVVEQQLDYWRNQLAGLRPVLDIATDRPRPPVQTNRGDIRPFSIDKYLCEELKSLSQANGATLFMTALSAFKTLLFRLSGETDIAVGSPIANRTRSELESIIGFFVNTLVLRTDLSGNPTFLELLEREREVAFGAFGHQDMPFEKLVDELQLDRDLSHNPLFQILFAVQNIGSVDRNAQAAPAASQSPAMGNGTAKFDLTMSMLDTGAGAQGFLEFNTDLFDAETAETIIERYKTLLAEIAEDPEKRLTEYSILTAEERENLPKEITAPDFVCQHRETIDEILSEHAAKTPKKAAIISGETVISYAELNRRAINLASRLQKSRVKPGSLIALAMPPGIDSLVSIFGILKAGCGYFVIDAAEMKVAPPSPDELPLRVQKMLADARPALILTDGQTFSQFPAKSGKIVNFDEIRQEIEKTGKAKKIKKIAKPEDTALRIYESVSGKKPKFAAMSHQELSHVACDSSVGLNAEDRVAFLSHSSSLASCFEIFGAITAGAAVVCIPSAVYSAPRKFAAALRDLGVTVMFSPIAKIQPLAREFPWALRSVRLLLSDEHFTDWQLLRDGLSSEIIERIYCLYGTPAAKGFYAVQALGELSENVSEIPLGKPFSHRSLYVLDTNSEPSGANVPGKVFVALNFQNSETENGFFPTGDIALRRASGALEYRNRADNVIFADGVAVFPEEIESVLREHPKIRDAAVALRLRNRFRNRGLGAIIESEKGLPTDEELNAFLSSRLPKHLIPTAFRADEIPRDDEGKIIRRDAREAVAEIDNLKSALDPYVAPRNEIENSLTQIWMSTLGNERIGVKDNFFRIGGHSLLATQAVARISDTFQIDFPLQKLFEYPTVEKLAEVIKPLTDSDFKSAVMPILRVPRDRPIPLSFAQQRLWFLDQYEPESPFYNIALQIPINGQINIPTLEAAFNDLIERHETLRTTFDVYEDQPIQIIAPSYEISMTIYDLQNVPEGQRTDELKRLISWEVMQPFDLKNGPIMRAGLVKLGAANYVLMFTIHHIAADGWSTDIVFKELWEFYQARLARRPANLPELKVQYADFASWQRKWLTGLALEKQLNYWREHLEGAPPLLELPTARPRPRLQTFNGSTYIYSMPVSLLEALKNLSEQEQTTLFITLLSGFYVLLHKYTGREDLVVGSPIANRTRPELEALIGFFANTLVLRAKLSGKMAFRQLIAVVREVTLGGYAHQDIPFEKLVEEFQPERNLSYNPLFQIMFALQNTNRPAVVSPTSTVEDALPFVSSAVSKFDLTMFVSETSAGLYLGIEYNTDLFTPAMIARFGEHYENILTAAVTDPDIPISHLQMLTSQERLLLSEWNNTGADYEKITATRMFEVQAERTPKATALIFGDESITYSELNKRANHWARYLIDAGARPETCVGISMKRSPEMIVAVLAVLKSGAAYLPVDPKYPKDRIEYMLADSRVSILFTDEDMRERFDGGKLRIVTIGKVSPKKLKSSNPKVKVGLDNLAYVIYTSGSTGRPKGVAMSHKPLTNLVQWQIRRSNLPVGARTLQFSSFSFDVSFQEIFSTLGAGGTLVLINEAQKTEPDEQWKVMKENNVNRLFLPYVALQQLAEHAKKLSELPPLTEVITAGEQLQVTPQIALLFNRLNAVLYNQYGPTESHIVTEYKLSGSPDDWEMLPPIGRPVPNTTFHIFDAYAQPCGVGIPGELYIGGDALARCYLHRVELTVERFVADSQSGNGRRLYKTGDLARFHEDGNIQYLGRIDEQVKIRGFRVEPGEIEAALRTFPMVNETVVVAREQQNGELQLVAYVEADPKKAPTQQQLREHLSAILPDYMIPSVFTVIETLPLTPSGKLSRKALSASELTRSADSAAMNPRTLVEEMLVQIWSDVLQIKNIGIEDNFFELGGHSLLATRVISRIFDELGADLPVRKIFESPTIEELAIAVTETILEAQDEDEMMSLLAEIEQMSEEEVLGLLQESEK